MDGKGSAVTPELFVWRAEVDYSRNGGGYSYPALPLRYQGLLPLEEQLSLSKGKDLRNTALSNRQPIYCPFCTSAMTFGDRNQCAVCGFWAKCFTEDFFDNTAPVGAAWEDTTFTVAELRRMSINDAELGMDELASHIRRRFADIYQLSPVRFEMLVEDIFRRLGYNTRRTQQTRDGGYDIVLLEKGSQEQILVECKRYALNRAVGVGVVRHLLGVQLICGVRKAKIVTTSRFSEVASSAVSSPLLVDSGIELELVDADRLLRELDVYNVSLPPLNAINF